MNCNFLILKSVLREILKIVTDIFESIWVKEFKNGPSKICEGQTLKNLTFDLIHS